MIDTIISQALPWLIAILGGIFGLNESKKRGVSDLAMSAMKNFLNRDSPEIVAPEVLADVPSAYTMSEATKNIIVRNMIEPEKSKILNVIAEKESARVGEYDLSTSRGIYHIINGYIEDIQALEIPTVDAGAGSIFRVWGGAGTTAGNVPKRQPDEISIGMSNRTLWISVRPEEKGGVTVGVFGEGKLLKKMLMNFESNDMTDNLVSFPTLSMLLPKDLIQESQETDGEFDLVVAVASGGKWFYLQDNDVIPWEPNPVKLKVILP